MTSVKVRTVLGDVEPASLGITLTHEHLLNTFASPPRGSGQWPPRGQVPDDPRANQPITLENIDWIRRYGSVHPDNVGFQDEALLVNEVMAFKHAGGGAMVDATIPDVTRDPQAMARIARATGIHVLAGCGHYVDQYHPDDMDDRSEEQLMQEIIHDVTVGCDGTDIKAGIIGEIGCTTPMTANEIKTLRAASRAQMETGAPLLIHPGRSVSAPFEAMNVVVEAGGDPDRTIMSHVDRTLFDHQAMVQLARTGCYIEFDHFGHEMPHYRSNPTIDMPNDAVRINHLQWLIAAGYQDKLVISHDIAVKIKLLKYGGFGYAHILENVVPIMKRKGMTQEQIDSILVHNPARILTMAPTGSSPQ